VNIAAVAHEEGVVSFWSCLDDVPRGHQRVNREDPQAMTSGSAARRRGLASQEYGREGEKAGASIPLKVTMAAIKPIAMPK